MVQEVFNSGLVDIILLTVVLLLLVLHELISGLEVHRLRRALRVSLVPVTLMFLGLVVIRLIELL
ncbi:MAG: hypothetical protein IPO91_03125 [Chloroflexi bacterium]|nr:hypothetical protein [Chloroflexota bacterium]